jgi:hypothetical protein
MFSLALEGLNCAEVYWYLLKSMLAAYIALFSDKLHYRSLRQCRPFIPMYTRQTDKYDHRTTYAGVELGLRNTVYLRTPSSWRRRCLASRQTRKSATKGYTKEAQTAAVYGLLPSEKWEKVYEK